GRGVRAGLTNDTAQPVVPAARGVGDGRPDGPAVAVRRRVDRELVVGHRPDDLGQAAVVLGPAVVERSDGHAAESRSAPGGAVSGIALSARRLGPPWRRA